MLFERFINNPKGLNMSIQRDTAGLIDIQFDLLEQVSDSKDLDLNQRIKNVGALVSGIRQVVSLELAHKQFAAKAPEFAKDVTPLALTKKKSKKS